MRRALLVFAFALSASRLAAQPVGTELRVNTHTTGDQNAPAVAVAGSSGDFVVVWVDNGADIVARRFTAAGAASTGEFRVNTYTTGKQSHPAVAADLSGGFVVVWESVGQDGSSYGVFGQRYGQTGAPVGGEFRVNEITTGQQLQPSIAMRPDGGFAVVWTGIDGSNNGVFGRRFAGGGAPLAGDFAVNTYTTGIQFQPSAAMDAAGNLVVAWQGLNEVEDPGGGIYARRFAFDGAPLGAEFRVNATTTGEQMLPSVAAAPSGAFVVVWQNGTFAAGYGIHAQRFSAAGAPAGGELLVDEGTTTLNFAPAVAATRDGAFQIVWQTSAASSYPVLARRLAANGVLGPALPVNTVADSLGGGLPKVAGGSGGGAVAWTAHADGSGAGIDARRFVMGPVTGDVDGNGAVDVLDVFYLINFLFANGPPPVS